MFGVVKWRRGALKIDHGYWKSRNDRQKKPLTKRGDVPRRTAGVCYVADADRFKPELIVTFPVLLLSISKIDVSNVEILTQGIR